MNDTNPPAPSELGSGAMLYRKKPVAVYATRIADDWFDGDHPNDAHPIGLEMDPALRCVWIPTLEGTMRGNVGDWIIRGVKGELYPCKPEIFEATYEVVTW